MTKLQVTGNRAKKNPTFVTSNYYWPALGNKSDRKKAETNILIILQQNQKSTDGLSYAKSEMDCDVSGYKDE